MTRKHFQLLADALRAAAPSGPEGMTQWHLDCHAVARACAEANPRFSRDRFLQACGAQAFTAR